MKNNTLIFGDSYSTFKGYIPEGYEVYYSEEENSETDVRKVEETWWFQVFKEKNFNLMLNNSWSGSTIGYTGYDNEDCSGSSSFIYRFRKLIESGFFAENEIDTMFIFGGTNDSWCKAPLGEMKYSDWEEKDFYSVLPAMCYFFNLVKERDLPEDGLTREWKAELLKIPVLDVVISEKRSPLMIAVSQTTASLYRCFCGESRKIVYPIM